MQSSYKPSSIDESVGDWQCSSCGNWNWARRKSCNKCDKPKGDQKGSSSNFYSNAPPGPPTHYSNAPSRPPPGRDIQRYVPPTEDFGYVVPRGEIAAGSEGRTIAIQAQAGWERKPKGTAHGEKRTGSAGGFKEFDGSEEEDRRKRRAIEDRQLKEERKAEKTKCAFCKRYACIC